MDVFQVTSLASGNNQAISDAVGKAFPDGYHLKMADYAWLVADSNKTTQEVCEKLGIGAEGDISSVIVVKCDLYWGRASKNIWEWITVKSKENGPQPQ